MVFCAENNVNEYFRKRLRHVFSLGFVPSFQDFVVSRFAYPGLTSWADMYRPFGTFLFFCYVNLLLIWLTYIVPPGLFILDLKGRNKVARGVNPG